MKFAKVVACLKRMRDSDDDQELLRIVTELLDMEAFSVLCIRFLRTMRSEKLDLVFDHLRAERHEDAYASLKLAVDHARA